MAPERIAHTTVKIVRRSRACPRAVERAGVPCAAFVEGVTVRVSSRRAFVPDASVICPPPQPNDIETSSPAVVLEIPSPSTAAFDHGPKLEGYFSLPSLAHYLLSGPGPARGHPTQSRPGGRDRDPHFCTRGRCGSTRRESASPSRNSSGSPANPPRTRTCPRREAARLRRSTDCVSGTRPRGETATLAIAGRARRRKVQAVDGRDAAAGDRAELIGRRATWLSAATRSSPAEA